MPLERLPRYRANPLSVVPDARFVQLVSAAKQHRLVLYLGAGVSVAPPAGGPTGSAVADALRPFVARILEIEVAALEGMSLEVLAQQVAEHADDRVEELRERASVAFDFRGIVPNFAHEAAALLLREGLVEVISVNWDCGVERGGLELGVAIQGVADLTESIQLAHSLPIYKVHGCATRPWTLAVTQSEVDEPQTWATGRTQTALTGGMVAFVGLGTIGLYVREPFSELVAAWADKAGSIVVVDPQMSESWEEALGEARAAEVHLERTADEFFDELLRALVLDALDVTEGLAREVALHDEWARTMVDGFDAVRRGFAETTAERVVRWWRDGLVVQSGTPFITMLAGQQCLMTVAYLAGLDGGTVAAVGASGRLTVETAAQYLEIVSKPGAHVEKVQVIARDRIEQRQTAGVYPTVKPVTVVIVGAMGEFPSELAPFDIAAVDESSADIAAGIETIAIRFVAAEDGVRGRLAA